MDFKNITAYELLQRQHLTNLKSEGYLLKHKKSGARIVLLENDDENKVFSIGFRTPPEDSTGVPHIIEHCVLCGSDQFPPKDPFVELVKGSLNTFLNAMTYPDKTVYPIASCNDQDFQNLLHVYMDAVFHPNIYKREEIFRQEGWNYKLTEAEGDLEYNGVVYNEMKGAFSSPEEVLQRAILNSLFPDTAYRFESGGDPEVIPQLTYEQFLEFHRKYYHPSNSYIYLYGNMDLEEKLNWMDQMYLSQYDAMEIDSAIGKQEPFSACKEVTIPYSITNQESEKDRTYLSYNKVIGTNLEKDLYLAFEVLDYALLSASGAPLKKALLDAGIGKDILGSYENGIYQPVFSIIAKDANVEQKEAFVETIEQTLREIVEHGIDEKAIAAGIHYHEFRYREADFGPFPKGLMYGLEIMDSWIFDETRPFIHVDAIETYAFLKEQIGTGYYESLIQTYLLENTHASIVVVQPEKGRSARLEKELHDQLQEYKASLRTEEVEELVAKTAKLQAYQEEPSTQEELETIPMLRREDISNQIEPLRNEERWVDDTKVVYHDIETNGIGYVNLLFDLSTISAEELPYVSMLRSILGSVDTTQFSYGELVNEINAYTGGIQMSLGLYPDVTKIEEKAFCSMFEVRAKAMYPQFPKTFEMIREILVGSNLQDEKRLKEILDTLVSRLQMRFQSAGHMTAALRASAYASPLSKWKEMTSGIEFYEKVNAITTNFQEEKEELIAKLTLLCKKIFCAEHLIVSYTAEREGLEGFDEWIRALKKELPTDVFPATTLVLPCEKKNEGFKTASKVQYVARAGNFIDQGQTYTGALHILKVILSYEYLWQNIRVKGGAYGCMSQFTRVGDGYFVSYRDPNLEQTNEVYEGTTKFLEEFTVSERDMTKYIIGTISSLDQTMTPAYKGERSMSCYFSHVTEEMLRKEREEVLTATQEEIRKLAPIVEAILNCQQLCVIGGEEKIEEAKALFYETKELR